MMPQTWVLRCFVFLLNLENDQHLASRVIRSAVNTRELKNESSVLEKGKQPGKIFYVLVAMNFSLEANSKAKAKKMFMLDA